MTAVLGLVAVVALVVATGFFVAAEFAMVAARRPALDELAGRGSRRARAALRVMRNLSFMLSGAQLGITVTTLVLGYVAESAFAALLRPAVELFGLPRQTTLAVSLAAALLVSTLLSMVVGELAPKNLAIARPETTALQLALPMRAYSIVFGPVIHLFDTAANGLSRLVGVEPQEELLSVYTVDELARIIEASGEEGTLTEEKATLLLRAVELGERRISEVMVPRPDVVWLRAGDPVGTLREAARATGYSRFPVMGKDEDDVVGTAHIKDLLDLGPGEAAEARISDLAYDALVVPESHTLRRLLTDLRRHHRTFAVVVDEFGGTAGIVTLEDVLESIVGDIEDEFDPGTPAWRRLGVGRYLVPGRIQISRLEQVLDEDLSGDYETAAGFLIDRLGHIPEVGEAVEHGAWRFRVAGVEGNRVTEIMLEPSREAEPAAASPSQAPEDRGRRP